MSADLLILAGLSVLVGAYGMVWGAARPSRVAVRDEEVAARNR